MRNHGTKFLDPGYHDVNPALWIGVSFLDLKPQVHKTHQIYIWTQIRSSLILDSDPVESNPGMDWHPDPDQIRLLGGFALLCYFPVMFFLSFLPKQNIFFPIIFFLLLFFLISVQGTLVWRLTGSHLLPTAVFPPALHSPVPTPLAPIPNSFQ